MRPSTKDLVDSLIRELPSWQLAVIRFNEAVAGRLGIASSDLQCLFTLDSGGPSTPGAIAAQVGLTTGSASRMIERLVRQGMVTTESDPSDRRRVVVTIGQSASRDLHAIYDPLDDRLRALLDPFSAEWLAGFLSFVRDAQSATVQVDSGPMP